MWLMAAVFGAVTVAAFVSGMHGNPTAASGVVGAGVCCVVCAVIAVVGR
jgi:hypothetical protein